MADIKIQNMVSTTSIAESLDLNKIAAALPETQYRSKAFPGLVLRIKEPKTAFLLFSSGKVVCTGAKTIEDVDRSIDKLCEKLGKSGFEVTKKPEITVQNIVASADLHSQLNMKEIAFALGLENIEYEPEVFPGMVYRLDEPRVVMLLFSSGKLICTGARNSEQVSEAVDKVAKELSERGLLR
jgi:transcription initiation factor TFIID TATA-box-binding protein